MIKRFFYIIIILCIALLGAAFSVRNGHLVNFNYYIGNVDLPLSVIMVAAFAAGVLLATLAVTFAMVKLRMQLGSRTRRYTQLEESYHKKVQELDKAKLSIKQHEATTLPDVVD